MSVQRWRWLGLGAAVLAVAAAMWVLSGPRSARTRGDGATGSHEAGTTQPGSTAAGRSAAVGVVPREVTIAGEGVVQGQVVDDNGAAVTEGRLVLWCLSPDGQVARIRDGVLALDEQGHFAGPACRGRVCPRLRHPYLIPASAWSLRAGTEVTLEARALPRLWGRVVDPRGQPVAAAQIVITATPDDDPTAVLPVVSARTSTDADGEFSVARIERPPCDPCQEAGPGCPDDELPVLDRVRVVARAPGWAPGQREVELWDTTDADSPVEVTLAEPGAAITGSLVDANAQPLARAVVLARSELRPHEQHQTRADDGTFAFDTLGDGPYTVRAIQDGRELTRQAEVEPGSAVELRLAQAQRDVVVTVVDSARAPVVDALVAGGPFAAVRTDTEGQVRAQRVVPGTYILRITPRNGRAQAHDLAIAPGSQPPGSAEIRPPLTLMIDDPDGRG